jgi:ATP-dependent Clp protease ATP-binding subunit ClpA
MEEGCLTDSGGRRVSFKNAIVVMTSNVGSEVRSDGLGFRPLGKNGEMDDVLRKSFTPEFLGRLDRVVHFENLPDEAMEAIARKYLTQLQQRTSVLGIQLVLPPELAAHLGQKSKGRGGARQIRRIVQEQVEGPLAAFLLQSDGKPERVTAVLNADGIGFGK